MKSHPSISCANKNYGVFHLSHRNNVDLIVGTLTSKKHWRKRWFWVDSVWQSPKGVYLLDASEKVFNCLQGRIKWGDMKLTSQQKSNLALAMSVLERCRLWSLLTPELALYNTSLEPTCPHDSFDAPLAFRDGVRIPNSLRHGTSDVINLELGSQWVESWLLMEQHLIVPLREIVLHEKTTSILDRGVRVSSHYSWSMICESLQLFILGDFTNFFLLYFQAWARR